MNSRIKGIVIILITVLLSWLLIPIVEWVGITMVSPYCKNLFGIGNWFLYLFELILSVSFVAGVILSLMAIRKTEYTPKLYSYTLIVGIICTILWGYFRFSKGWTFYGPFQNIISFIDLFVLSIWIVAIGMIWQMKHINIEEEEDSTSDMDTYIPDTPIESSEEDTLNRSKIASSLAMKIKNLKKIKGAHSIAITAPWGNGKTSFLNLIKKELKGRKIEIIDIAPWHISPQTSITTHFFNELTKRFNKIDDGVSKFLSEYLELLDSVKLGWVSKFTSTPELAELSEQISIKLEELNKIVMIVFDDLDRLNAPEIEEVFRIIRGSANFTNFIFISAFDKRYIQEALKNSNPAINEQYIDKFFEAEYSLPEFTPSRLCATILSKCEWLNDNDKKEFSDYINRSSFLSIGEKVFHLLPNLRSIYRWLNAIKQKYSILQEECKIVDLANLEMLNILFPSVYSLLAKEHERYLECERYASRYKLWKESMRVNSKEDLWRSIGQKRKLDLLKVCEDELKMSQRDLLDVSEILDRIFPQYGSTSEFNSISNPNYTKRYFDGILDKSEITKQEFGEFFSGKVDYKAFIDSDKEDEEYRHSLLLHCHYARPTDDNDKIRLLEIIFYAAQNYKHFGFPKDSLIMQLNNLSKSDEEKKNVCKNLMLQNGFSLFVIMLLSPLEYSNQSGFWTLLSRKECDEIIAEMLQIAIKEKAEFNDITEIFAYSRTLEYESVGNNRQRKVYVARNSCANAVFKKYLAKNFLENISSLVWIEHHSKEYYPSSDFTEMWNTWDEFKSYLSEMGISYSSEEDLEKFDEYGQFFNQWKANDEKTISFDFNFISK